MKPATMTSRTNFPSDRPRDGTVHRSGIIPRMKILIVNANTELLPNPVIPLGACLVASSARAAGHDVRFLDLAFEADLPLAVRGALDAFAPDAAGVSIRNIDNTDFLHPKLYLPRIRDEVIAPLQAVIPGRIALGGAGFSTMPEETLAYMGADAGVVGDGEQAFLDLLSAWEGGSDVESIPGTVHLANGAVRAGPAPRLPRELDAFPTAQPWQWVDLKRYAAYGGYANLQTKRGCPLKCAYCVYNKVEGEAYRLRSPEAVAQEIAGLKAHGVTDVEFTDSTFNIPLDHAKSVLSEIIHVAPGMGLSTAGMNPRKADEELFELMGRAGFRTIMISAEAASDAALEGLGKGYTVDAVERMVALSEAAGFDVFWYFLFGGPGETEATYEETLGFLAARIPRHHLVYLGAGIRVQKGAPVEAVAREQGVVAPDDDLLEPIFYFPPTLDRDRLLERIRQEVLAHPNYLQVEDYQNSTGPLKLARLLKFLRVRRPAWAFVPWMNRLLARLGRKRR